MYSFIVFVFEKFFEKTYLSFKILPLFGIEIFAYVLETSEINTTFESRIEESKLSNGAYFGGSHFRDQEVTLGN